MIENISKLPPIPAASTVTPVARPGAVTTKPGSQPGVSFGDVLQETLRQPEELKFSAHARSRLQSRQIQLNETQLDRLRQGVGQAADKGAQDSLVLLDDLAFVVSVRNNTVVTALDKAGQSGHVFTKIDSTVFA